MLCLGVRSAGGCRIWKTVETVLSLESLSSSSGEGFPHFWLKTGALRARGALPPVSETEWSGAGLWSPGPLTSFFAPRSWGRMGVPVTLLISGFHWHVSLFVCGVACSTGLFPVPGWASHPFNCSALWWDETHPLFPSSGFP